MTTVHRRKSRNLLARPVAGPPCVQLVGPRWITLEGPATVSTDPPRVVEGMRRYAKRYSSQPPQPPGLAVIEIAVDRVMGLY